MSAALIPPALAPAAYAAMNIASATGIVFANKAGEHRRNIREKCAAVALRHESLVPKKFIFNISQNELHHPRSLFLFILFLQCSPSSNFISHTL